MKINRIWVSKKTWVFWKENTDVLEEKHGCFEIKIRVFFSKKHRHLFSKSSASFSKKLPSFF